MGQIWPTPNGLLTLTLCQKSDLRLGFLLTAEVWWLFFFCCLFVIDTSFIKVTSIKTKVCVCIYVVTNVDVFV